MKGVYLLFVKVLKDSEIKVGGLGSISFKRGLYVYVGSAQNNLEKRILRHKSKKKKLKWHIDYLTVSRSVKVIAACAYQLPKKYECIIARNLSKVCLRSIRGFGSSDCRCVSHLFRVSGNVSKLCRDVSEIVGRKPQRMF